MHWCQRLTAPTVALQQLLIECVQMTMEEKLAAVVLVEKHCGQQSFWANWIE